MSDIREWISEFRNLSGVGLIDAKGAYDANPGKTPAEVWEACGGKVPQQVVSLESENADLRAENARLRDLAEWLSVRIVVGGKTDTRNLGVAITMARRLLEAGR